MDFCPNCGCKRFEGACVNCHEETYIFQQHLEDPCCELSDEFMDKVRRQKREIERERSCS
jgi:hypothetical protein